MLSFEDAIGDIYGEINDDAELEELFNTMILAVMVQALDLTEDQAAAIMPAMNKNEEEKRQLQQANYIIFSQEFYRGLQQQLDNARRNQQRSQQLRRKKR